MGKQAHGVRGRRGGGEEETLPLSADRGQCDSESQEEVVSKRGRWEADGGMGGVTDGRGRQERSTHTGGGGGVGGTGGVGTHSPAHHSPFPCCVSMLPRARRAGPSPRRHLDASDRARHCPSRPCTSSVKGAHIGSLEAEFIMCP